MPIVLVHGVRERSRDFWPGIDRFLEAYVTPILAPDDSDNVPILRAYWGDVGACFRWGGISRPRSVLFQQGVAEERAARAIATASVGPELQGLPQPLIPASAGRGMLVPMGTGQADDQAAEPRLRLSSLAPRDLSDLLATIIARSDQEPERKALMTVAADGVAHDPTTQQELRACATAEEEIDVLLGRIEARYRAEQARGSALVEQGAGDWLRKHIGDPLKEVTGRSVNLPGWVINRVLTELRGPINEALTGFFGDVFVYLDERGTKDAPGDIPKIVLDTLKAAKDQQERRNGEPIVVLSHSMGGQVVYDAVTTWLPRLPQYAGIRIDFWTAAASQVGLFEELKLFLASDERYGNDPARPDPTKTALVPRPRRSSLGGWWNVWDHNDFLSFRVKNIIEGIDDEGWNTGKWFPFSHGGYFEYASFFKELATKLKDARANNWWRGEP